jgi:hypothetical protein
VKRKAYIGLFAVLMLLYLGLSLLVPADKATLAHYHLSVAGARAITASVVVPIAIIWTIGAFGSLQIKDYSQLIKKSKEGEPLNIISDGLMVLVIAQVLISDLGNIVALLLRHHLNWAPTLTIVNNYLAVLLTGAGLSVIAVGAWRLMSLLRHRPSALFQHGMTFLLIVLSAIYSYSIIREPLHTPLGHRLYYIPDWLILLSIAIPYLVFWYFGLLASYCIYNYQKNVQGRLYKGSLGYIAAGIAMVVVSSIAVRFLATVSTKLSRLRITPILLIIYGFLALIAIGFLLIAWGARKLRRIEEV